MDDSIHQQMKDIAQDTMRALDLQNYARVDFFVTPDDQLYVIEANNLPGMTPLSLLPQEAEAAGIKYPELVDSIVRGKMDLYDQGLAI